MCAEGDIDLSEIVMLRMIETMDRLIADQRVQLHTPQHVLETLIQANEWLRRLLVR
jgi:hypothetical protein